MGERGKSKMESGKFCKAVSRVLQGRGQPGPAAHLRNKQAIIKMVKTKGLSFRGGAADVGISQYPPRPQKSPGETGAPKILTILFQTRKLILDFFSAYVTISMWKPAVHG